MTLAEAHDSSRQALTESRTHQSKGDVRKRQLRSGVTGDWRSVAGAFHLSKTCHGVEDVFSNAPVERLEFPEMYIDGPAYGNPMTDQWEERMNRP